MNSESHRIRILCLEDNLRERILLEKTLAAEGLKCEITHARNEADFTSAVKSATFDLIISDFTMPAFNGLAALAMARRIQPETPFLFVSGTMGEEQVVESLKSGALDYVLKEHLGRLGSAVRRALREAADHKRRRRAEARLEAFSSLGHRLAAAQSAKEAARIIVDVADRLLGWDCCYCNLYSAAEDTLQTVLNIDLINGKRTECPSVAAGAPPTHLARRAIHEGGQLVLREEAERLRPDSLPFGDVARASASLLCVPIRNGEEVTGVLSIQSYAEHAYDEHSLETLQALADHCGGALHRIRTQEELRANQARLQLQFDRLAAFSPLGYRLSATKTAKEAARIILDVADQMLGWDACFCYLYSAAEDLALHVLNLDTINGARVEGAPFRDRMPPSPLLRRTIEQGAQLILREPSAGMPPESVPFGDVARPSASLLCVPLRNGATVIGVLSIQSYKSRAYDREDLEALQSLGDHCGGALDRIRTQEELLSLQGQLRQSQKMEAVGQLAGGVAHDFNNLLAIIRGNTELALMSIDESGSELTRWLKDVIEASERAAALTRQLLAFGRKQLLQPRLLNLGEVAANLTRMLKRVIGEDIDLKTDYAANLPSVHADVGMMEQVLLNLVVNARDAMPHGGKLMIATERVTLDQFYVSAHPEARAGEFVALSITDTGTGISSEHLPHIFEPFFTTKAPGKGTGLGLATVYGIVKQHEGWIEVASQPGAGSTFKFFLPAVEIAAAEAAVAAPGAPSRGGTETILLVEDDFGVRSFTRQLLENYGYSIREASSGPEALQLHGGKLSEIDLLVTDLIMPDGITGRELGEQLRGIRPNLKIIFMSGYSADVLGQKTDFFRRTNSRFLQKPFTSQALLDTVRVCLDTT